MEIDDITTPQLVTFAIFMESNDGIMGKSPDYIREKFKLCMMTAKTEYLERNLDRFNQAKYTAWRKRWILPK